MKKTIVLPFISFMVLQVVAQNKNVTIRGMVQDTTVKSIEITHPVDANLAKWEDKKVDVENGIFNTLIQVSFPVEISFTYGNKISRKKYIYADTDVLIDTAGTLHITGSPIQDEYDNEFFPFFQSNDQVYDTMRSFYGKIYQQYGQDIPKLVKDSAILLQNKYYYGRAALLSEYIRQHPNSYIPLWDIYFFASLPPTHKYFDFEKLFSSFSNQLQRQPFITVLRERIKESAKMQVGRLFPKDFFKGYEQMQSKIEKNSQYYLIDFWFSHCAPCIEGFPKLKAIYRQFHDKGFDIVSISVDKPKDNKDYAAAIQKYGLAWNHVWDKDGKNAKKFNINSFPTYILLDKNGSIVNSDIEVAQLEAFLKEHLGSL